jgi:hypothetical protein
MRLSLLLLTVALSLSAQVTQPKSTTGKVEDNRTNQESSAPSQAIQKPPSSDPGKREGEIQKGSGDNPSVAVNSVPPILVKKDGWDYFGALLNCLLVVATGATFGAILYQSIQTKRSAEAAKINAEAALLAIRPWITVELESSTWDNFSVVARNVGKTPAEIWRSEGELHFVKDIYELPDDPKYVGDQYVLEYRPLTIPGEDPSPVYSTSINALREGDRNSMLEVGFLSKELYIWGIISYGIPGEKKISFETRWCFKYVPGIPREQDASGQLIGGLRPQMIRGGKPGYNEHT